MTFTITTPTLCDIIGPVPYWLLVVMLGCFAATCLVTTVSIVYGEIYRQIEELRRVNK